VGAARRERARYLPPADLAGLGGGAAGRDQALERLARALRAAHAEVTERHIVFEDVVNSLVGLETLLGLGLGYGQLANGPVTLLRRFAAVAETHGVPTRLSVTGPGRAGLCLLELGETYVVAERFGAS
jgi:hypothetical protein